MSVTAVAASGAGVTRLQGAMVRLAVSGLLCALVFLQKFALPVGALQVSVLVPALLASIVLLLASSRLKAHEGRVALFLAFLCAFCFGQGFVSAPISLASVALLLVLYAPMCFVLTVTAREWAAIVGDFLNLLLVLAGLVWLQLGWQAAFGEGNTLNLEHWVPQAALLEGYIYDRPYRWGAAFVRPNGLFLLEPSFASLFLATALLLELEGPRRALRLLAYGSALLGTLAGTGLLAVGAAAPLLAWRLPPRWRAVAFAGLLAMLAAAAVAGLLEVFATRWAEFSTPGSSAWLRFVEPFNQIGAVLQQPFAMVTGIGAGNVSDTEMNAWPFVKLAIEYGLLSAILFLVFLGFTLPRSPAPATLCGLFIVYSFSGGYLLSPVVPLLLLVLGAWPRVRAGSAPASAKVASAGKASPAQGPTPSPRQSPSSPRRRPA